MSPTRSAFRSTAPATELVPIGAAVTSPNRGIDDAAESARVPPMAAQSSGPKRVASTSRGRGALMPTESKDEAESSSFPASSSVALAMASSPARSSAAAAALAEDDGAAAASSDEEEDKTASGPTAADVYARPLLFYKRAAVDRARRQQEVSVPELGPAQLILPDSGMALGFPPLKDTTRAARRDDPLAGDAIVVFTPPNEDQASKTKLWMCILLLLIPADVVLIFTIYFLGDAIIDDDSYSSGTTDLVSFLCALVALGLGLVGMKLRDTRLLTLFIVIYYVDAMINLVRISSILQLAQFFMQIGVCHSMSHFKSTLVPQWWIADT